MEGEPGVKAETIGGRWPASLWGSDATKVTLFRKHIVPIL